MVKFGWCQAPPGVRPMHAQCRGVINGHSGMVTCECRCHFEHDVEEAAKPAKKAKKRPRKAGPSRTK